MAFPRVSSVFELVDSSTGRSGAMYVQVSGELLTVGDLRKALEPWPDDAELGNINAPRIAIWRRAEDKEGNGPALMQPARR